MVHGRRRDMADTVNDQWQDVPSSTGADAGGWQDAPAEDSTKTGFVQHAAGSLWENAKGLFHAASGGQLWDKIGENVKSGNYADAAKSIALLATPGLRFASPIVGALDDSRKMLAHAADLQTQGKHDEARQAANGAALHLGTVVLPHLEAAADQFKKGNMAEGAGDLAGDVATGAMLHGATKIPGAIDAIPEGAGKALKEGATAAAPDVGKGAAKVAGGYALAHFGPSPVADAIGAYQLGKSGGRQIVGGVKTGYSALKKSLAETAANSKLASDAGATAGPVSAMPAPASGAILPADHEENLEPINQPVTPASNLAPAPESIPAAGPVSAMPAPATPGAVPGSPEASRVPVSLPGSGLRPTALESPASDTQEAAPAGNVPRETPQPDSGGWRDVPNTFESAYEVPKEERTIQRAVAPAESYQKAARTTKARALARWLRLGSIPFEDAKGMTPEQWKMAADGAAVNVPSETTIREYVLPELEKLYKHKGSVNITNAISEGDIEGAHNHADAISASRDTLSGNAAPAPSEGKAGTSGPAGPFPAKAPAVAPGDLAKTAVAIPGGAPGSDLPARYALRELDDIQPSHSGLTFQENPKYGLVNDRDYSARDNQAKVIEGAGAKFNPRYHVSDNPDATNGPVVVDSAGNALGGNGRTMMLQRVYAQNAKGTAAYRELLTKKAAQFGIDPASVAKMSKPVLVREIADADLANPQNAITDLNKTGTAALRPSERAIADSRRVSTQTLDQVASHLEDAGPSATLGKVLGAPAGADILNRLINDDVITQQERAGLATGDKLTAAGKSRITQLLLGRFFHDPAQLDRMPAPIVGKLERIAAPLARLEATDWSLTPRIQEALSLIEESQVHGTPNLKDFVNQSGLFKSQQVAPEVLDLATKLQKLSAAKLKEALARHAQDASFTASVGGLFGAPTAGESFRDAFKPAPVKKGP